MRRLIIIVILLIAAAILVLAMLASGASSYINLRCLLTGHDWEVIESKECPYCGGLGYLERYATSDDPYPKCTCFNGMSEYTIKCKRCSKMRHASATRSLRGIIKEHEPKF